MTLVFNSGVVTDKSGNGNNAKTITIGRDEPSAEIGISDSIWESGIIREYDAVNFGERDNNASF